LPHKRFVIPVVQELTESFLDSDRSYRATVRSQGQPLVYDDRVEGVPGDGQALSHSSVWRWLSWFGDGIRRTVQLAQQLIAEKEPGATLHRETWSVSPHKYRSERRRETLQEALRSLVVGRIFERLFGKALFSPTWKRVAAGPAINSLPDRTGC
jgi:hypothetical protein